MITPTLPTMSTKHDGFSSAAKNRQAFTVIELLAIVTVLGLLATVMVTGQARTKGDGRRHQCLANTKRLMQANLMYQAENRDALPMVFHGGFVPTATDTSRPWATGWQDWTVGSDNTNVTYLLNPRYASLAVYLNGDASVYKCPSDTYASPAQIGRGWKTRARSYVANLYVGKGNGWASGSWGAPSGPNNLTIYRGAAKSSDLRIPGPAQTWVYMDEHADSINDPGGWAPDSPTNIPDAPATYHNGAACFTMADGHSEIHRWQGLLMNKPRQQGGLSGVILTAFNNFQAPQGDPDLYWYSYATPRKTTSTVAD
jgi:type II secretory pathway pseudopilin PulG